MPSAAVAVAQKHLVRRFGSPLSRSASLIHPPVSHHSSSGPDQASGPVRRDLSFNRKRRLGTSSHRRRFLFPCLYCPKKDGRISASHRPKTTKQIHNLSSLPHGVRSFNLGTVKTRRMDGKHRSQGCLPPHSHCSAVQKIPSSEPARDLLPIQGPLFWLKYSAKSFHKTLRPGCGTSSVQGLQSPPLPGRLVAERNIASGSPSSISLHSISPLRLGSYCQQGKIRPHSQTEVCFSRYGCRPSRRPSSTFPPKSRQIDRSPSVLQCSPTSLSTSAAIVTGTPQPSLQVCHSGEITCQALAVFRQGPSPSPQAQLGPVGTSRQTLQESSGVVDTGTPSSTGSFPTPSRPRGHLNHRRKPGRLERSDQRCSILRSVGSGRGRLAHLPAGASSSEYGSPKVCCTTGRSSGSGPIGQPDGGGLYKEPRRDTLGTPIYGSQETSPVVLRPPDSTGPSLHSRETELPSRLGFSSRSSPGYRMDSAQCCRQETGPDLPISGDRPVRHKIQHQTTEVCQPLPGPSGLEGRRFLFPMGRVSSLCLPTYETPSRSFEETSRFLGQDGANSPQLAQSGLVPGPIGSSGRPSIEPASVEQTPLATRQSHIPQQPLPVRSTRLASLCQRIRQEGFSEKVAKYAAAPQRDSTRRLYDCHWQSFSHWCGERDTDPSSASISTLAEFLVFLFEVKHFNPRTIANYRSSLAAVLGSVEGVPVSLNPVLSNLIKAFNSTRPLERPRVPEWDLAKVLRHLRSPYYEPPSWDTVEARMRCTQKTAFLVALAKTDRRGELQALSRDSRDLIFTDSGMSMRTIPGFLPKAGIPGMDPAPFLVPSLTPFSGSDNDDRLLCPVRMVRKYLAFTGGPRPKERLFLKVKGQGHPSAQTVAHWISACVRAAHQDTPGLHISAHEVRRMSASWAFHGGVHSTEDILLAGSWASHSTFTSFYLANIRLQPDGRRRLHPIVAGKQLRNF